MSEPLIRLKGIERRYQSGEHEVTVLHRWISPSMPGDGGHRRRLRLRQIDPDEPAGLPRSPERGQYLFRGQDTATLDALSLARLRCHHFGFIFQRYHLLPHLDAAANVEIPAIYAGTARLDRQARARTLLTRLGLQDRSHHRPGQLSGGQQQRVSIARALANGGEVILADEPTGALDSQSGKEVMAILKELHAQGHTIILVTHDMAVASHADRIITLRDGRVVEDSGHRATDDNAPSPSGTPAHPLPGDGSQLGSPVGQDAQGTGAAVRTRKPGLGSLPGGGAHGPARHAGPSHAHLPHHARHHHRHRRRGQRGGAGSGRAPR